MRTIIAWALAIGACVVDYWIMQQSSGSVQAIDPAVLATLIGIGAGVAKSELSDRPKERRQRKLKAIETALSPFTGLQPQTQIQAADPIGTAIGFGATGASIGSGLEAQAAQLEQNQKLLEILEARERARAGNTFAGISGLSPAALAILEGR